MKVVVTSTEREVFIKFDGITHFRCDRRELLGLQSWKVNRGRETIVYAIEILTRCGSNIVLEYDDVKKWKTILAGLDSVSFLNEWKVQDP